MKGQRYSRSNQAKVDIVVRNGSKRRGSDVLTHIANLCGQNGEDLFQI